MCVKRSPHRSVAVVSSSRSPRLPAVGHVRRVKVAHSLAAEIDHLAVRKYARWSVSHIVKRDEASRLAMNDFCRRSCREPLVHGPTFIGLIMTEHNPS